MPKRTWKAAITSVLNWGKHIYEGDTLVGYQYQVRVLFTIQDVAALGREVEVWMDPEVAEEFGNNVIHMAAQAREKNAQL